MTEATEAFQDYLKATFPEDAKRTRSSVIHRSFADRIVRYLKQRDDSDKHFRHYVIKEKWI